MYTRRVRTNSFKGIENTGLRYASLVRSLSLSRKQQLTSPTTSPTSSLREKIEPDEMLPRETDIRELHHEEPQDGDERNRNLSKEQLLLDTESENSSNQGTPEESGLDKSPSEISNERACSASPDAFGPACEETEEAATELAILENSLTEPYNSSPDILCLSGKQVSARPSLIAAESVPGATSNAETTEVHALPTARPSAQWNGDEDEDKHLQRDHEHSACDSVDKSGAQHQGINGCCIIM